MLFRSYEEEYLHSTFGDEYARYVAHTGRFIPLSLELKGLSGPFDGSILWKSEIHSLLVTLLGTALLLWRVC